MTCQPVISEEAEISVAPVLDPGVALHVVRIEIQLEAYRRGPSRVVGVGFATLIKRAVVPAEDLADSCIKMHNYSVKRYVN